MHANPFSKTIAALFLVFLVTQGSTAESPFSIRGTLPWHNFLSGPTAWNEDNYQAYLDWMAERNLNFIGFHCYTGGSQRYVTYVEPMLRASYRGVLPEAQLDTSLTARWGYIPLATDQFAFGSSKQFDQNVFGAECAVNAQTTVEHYQNTQSLMRNVFEYAQQKGIHTCIGFEFGVYPPEFYSVLPHGSMLPGVNVPDPFHPANREILWAYIENIQQTYPNIDYVWFWLQELYNPMHISSFPTRFQRFYDGNQKLFADLNDDRLAFNGVWSLAYIQQAQEIMNELLPEAKMVISGWGGSHQLPPLLPGLDKALPEDIIFSCLSPNQGWDAQPQQLVAIDERDVWIIPWLEGDKRLWHPQPRVSILADHIAQAARQNVEGVIGIHWRTKDIHSNFDAFAKYTNEPPSLESNGGMSDEQKQSLTREFYEEWCVDQYGDEAGNALVEHWVKFDTQQLLAQGNEATSPEYWPYNTDWGRLSEELRKQIVAWRDDAKDQLKYVEDENHYENLNYLIHTLNGILALEQVGEYLEPAANLKDQIILKEIANEKKQEACVQALKQLKKAPVQTLVRSYSQRVQSRGDLGVLSSINQKVWTYYQELQWFLENELNR